MFVNVYTCLSLYNDKNNVYLHLINERFGACIYTGRCCSGRFYTSRFYIRGIHKETANFGGVTWPIAAAHGKFVSTPYYGIESSSPSLPFP